MALMVREYILLIEKEQEIDLDALQEILKNISKEYREYLYKNGEFEKESKKYDYYPFIRSKNFWTLQIVRDKLHENNVFCVIWKLKYWRKWVALKI